jgi:hypothetical protein
VSTLARTILEREAALSTLDDALDAAVAVRGFKMAVQWANA